MAQSIVVGNKVVTLPGVYTQINAEAPGAAAEEGISYSNLCMLASDLGDNTFPESLEGYSESEALFYVKNAAGKEIVEKLFHPYSTYNGINKLFVLQGASNKPATATVKFGSSMNVTFETKEKGAWLNTVKQNSSLTKGYLIVENYANSTAWIEIYQGSESGKQLLYKSPKVETPQTLVKALNKSSIINSLFTLKVTSVEESFTASLAATTEDSFTGGENGAATALSQNLADSLKYMDVSGILLYAVPTGIEFDSNVEVFIVKEEAPAEASINLDSDQYVVIANKADAPAIVGRILGLSPEIPCTLKSIDSENKNLVQDSTLEDYLNNGVMTSYFDPDLNSTVISQGVTTIQRNSNFVNEDDCTTYSLQLKRIINIVIKTLRIQAKQDFFGGNASTNKGSLSDSYVKAWTENQLGKMTYAPNKTDQNYLLDYKVTKVETVNDTKKVYLQIRANSEITKVVFLVTILGE